MDSIGTEMEKSDPTSVGPCSVEIDMPPDTPATFEMFGDFPGKSVHRCPPKLAHVRTFLELHPRQLNGGKITAESPGHFEIRFGWISLQEIADGLATCGMDAASDLCTP